MEEVTDEPLYRDRVCGIDIGKAELYATIRVPSDKDPARRTQRDPQLRYHEAGGAGAGGLDAVLAGAGAGDGGDRGLLERPVFYRLEAEGFECVLADAKQVKNLPGRPKRDPSDSSWLAQCFERGSVRPCFVATPEFRVIRLHTRYRRDLTEDRTREKHRAEKLLESAAIKLSSVVTDLHGVTGRDIMDHLIAGERNPKVLAQLARGRARRKISDLEAGPGRRGVLHSPSTPPCSRPCSPASTRSTPRSASWTAVIETAAGPVGGAAAASRVDARLGPPLRPGRPRRDRPGHDQVRHRRSPGLLGRPHPAGQAVRQTRSGRAGSKKGNKYIGRHHRRDRRRRRQDPDPRRRPLPQARPHAAARHKACVALGNTQLKVYHKLLSSPGMRYQDLGPDYYDNRASTRRQVRALQKRASELGYTLVPDLTGCPEIA